jgi:hypothetical protein
VTLSEATELVHLYRKYKGYYNPFIKPWNMTGLELAEMVQNLAGYLALPNEEMLKKLRDQIERLKLLEVGHEEIADVLFGEPTGEAL